MTLGEGVADAGRVSPDVTRVFFVAMELAVDDDSCPDTVRRRDAPEGTGGTL